MKAARQASHRMRFVQWLFVLVTRNNSVGVLDVLFRNRIAISRGIEVVKVYIMK